MVWLLFLWNYSFSCLGNEDKDSSNSAEDSPEYTVSDDSDNESGINNKKITAATIKEAIISLIPSTSIDVDKRSSLELNKNLKIN